ncbi:MAG: proline dehydrogenase family protein [Dehalococcoidia bacterium]
MTTPAMPDGAAIEARTQVLGRALIDRAAQYRPAAGERIEDWLLTHAVADDRFRSRLLRYMDVLASLDYDAGGAEAKRLAREYFAGDFPALPRPLRWLLRVARDEHLPAPVVGEAAHRSASLFASRFITPPGDETIRATLAYLEAHDRAPSFDLLGEAVLSEHEAAAYTERYLALIARLAPHPAARRRTPGGLATLQLSLKLSSLTHRFTPVDPEGSAARVSPALETIARAARDAGIGLTVDMEQYELRDLAWETFRQVFARGGPLGDWGDAGIVVQGYLRDAEAQAEALVRFAGERGTPVHVRLVKGAYWDYERMIASANRWPPPVHTAKADTDAQFERLLGTLTTAYPDVRLAVASHNLRSHAVAEAIAESAGLPAGGVEHQTLFRTAEGTSRALAAMGWPTRDYVPVGELLPGMAYLVRRVLENSSQAGFLLQSRSGASPETLLRPPRAIDDPAAVAPESAPFARTPSARWFDPAFRAAFEDALTGTRAAWGASFPLVVGGQSVAGAAVDIHSPSEPGGPPVGTATFADAATALRAAAVARAAAPAWAATPVSRRAEILHRAADLLEERGHTFAAWIVHEGGRDRADAWGEVEEAADFLRCYAVEAERLFALGGARLAPRGVVAVIPPWNFSLSIPCGMTAAALACGNTVVLKPAKQTPLIAHRLIALLHEAGVPLDAAIALPGAGDVAGQALVDGEDVAMIAFTGSRAVGTRLHEAVSRVPPRDGVVKALVAEMGGKNPVLVFADADLDEAVAGIIRSAFGHANQKCSAASRILVAAPVYERLRERLVEAARSLIRGRADEAATELNPVIDAEALERLRTAAATARAECTVLLDAFDPPPRTLQPGPLIVELPAARALTARTATEELFGPILVLIPFHDEGDAYRIANGTGYALTSGVFSRSPLNVERAARAIEAGHVYVNRATTGARVGIEPFGGMYLSGTGPKAGHGDYLWAFTRRLDVPAGAAVEADMEAAEGAPPGAVLAEAAAGLARWDAPLEERIATIERAVVLLGQRNDDRAIPLFAVAQAARRELVPHPTLPVAGQHTEMRYDVPRGLGVVHARGQQAAWWLGATLAAGNAALVVASPDLAAVAAALVEAGAPSHVLRAAGGGSTAVLEAAALPGITFAATDAGPATERRLYGVLGPTRPSERSLRALISTLDGPQPGEPGFVRRFSWSKVVAIRTLRHGAELGLEASAPAEG